MSAEFGGRPPLSFSQEFMCLFDEGDEVGPYGSRYHMVYGWRLRGRVDVGALRGALDDVVARHEALRTVVVRGADARYQEIHPPSPAELVVRDLTGTDPAARDRVAEELLIELEADEFSSLEMPLLRGALGRFDDQDSVLALIVHHAAADGWSMQLIIKELAQCYAARREQRVADLPEVLQYREYAIWERTSTTDESLARSREYWRKKLDGARFTAVRTDFPRSANLPKNTSVERYLVDPELTAATLELARSTRSSPFMVLLAAYKVLLRELTGVTDITVTTIMSGRGIARYDNTIGSFFNLVPLRTDLAGCDSFREVLGRTRRTCLGAFTHAIPFTKMMADVPVLGDPYVADNLASVSFQVFQFPFVMAAQRVGDLEYSEIRRRLLPAAVSTDIPDGALLTIDIDPAGGEMIGQLQFNSNLFDVSTIRGMVSQYQQVVKRSVAD
jgi:hypothetical protein